MKIRLIDFTHLKTANARSRILLLCFLSILFSCVPRTNTLSTSESTSNNINNTNNGNIPGRSNSASVDQSPLGEPTKDLYWYSNHTIANETLTINADMLSVVYLRGNKVEEYLDSTGMSQAFCLVTTYAEDNAKKQMRLRTVPINYNNLSLGRVEKILRVDVPSKSLNESFCQGTVDNTSSITDLAFSPLDMCPTCLRTFNSKSVKLFQSNGEEVAEEVPSELLYLSSLSIRIDPTNASTSNASECNDTLCSSKGYDCCLNGQCVNDGESRPNAIEHPEYFQSRLDIKSNLLNFTKYPEIYYVCSNIVRDTVEDNSTTSGECSNSSLNTQQECESAGETFTTTTEIANQTFEQYKKEYFCLLEGEKENPNYAIGSCSLIDYVGETSCTNAGGTWTRFCYPSGSEENFISIRSNVWDRCGCEADPFNTTPEDNPCPDFGLRASKNTAGEILEITCKVPLDVVDPPIFQELSIDVPTRAAPHRFFIDYNGDTEDYLGENFDELTLHLSDFQEKQIGTQVDDIIEKKLGATSPILSNVVPQGFSESFGYADNANKRDFLGADNLNFNAILGQFDVQLSGAKPASVVYVEYGQNYIIRAKEGRYEPCVMCDIDSWFDNFSPHPPSTQGRGLEAVGFTASRDNYVSNITMGNYEDTIFGRACWVPLTMIPMSHKNIANTRTSRKLRLLAQTALYANGYQRDWFGFNKGALIGSFDGVRWFAIGGGRRVTAKSSKLYLAINGAFPDLVTPGSISVSILTDNGINVASDQDFDPNLSDEDARIESGASCQKYHQCEYDADCVTQLGWEYMCADVSQYRTTVPEFDFHANEKDGELFEEKISIGMSGFLHNAMPSGSKKRCVYRGAGSVCKRNFTNLDRFQDNESDRGSAAPVNRAKINRQKLITCAPNFYCAKFLDNDFNDQVVRNVSNNSLILYGQDADVLGRPLNYVGGGQSLGVQALNYDASIRSYYSDPLVYKDTGGDGDTGEENFFQWGICRPGKSQASDTYLEQHQSKDTLRRSDYVSQVGSCDPDERKGDRVLACPIFDMRPFINEKATKPNGNFLDYIFYSNENNTTDDDSNVLTTFDKYKSIRLTQNACGKEVQFDPDGTGDISIFKDIENPNNPSSFLVPGLSEVSCMRRAGAVCHTDLECSPNKFHAEVAETYGVDAFGNTLAEKEYWEQYLVCGQKDRPPHVSGLNFDSYDLRKNRCCREVGKEITMHTHSNDTNASTDGYLITYDPNLDPLIMTSDDPTIEGRYSRYGKDERAGNNIPTVHKNFDWINYFETSYRKPQWKIFQETGRNTCCGNGFVRKFADGTNDWSNRNRLNIPPESFTCLNYRNEFAEAMKDEKVKNRLFDTDLRTSFDIDQNMYCISPHEGQSSGWSDYPGNKEVGNGCPQISLAGDDPDDDEFTAPKDIDTTILTTLSINNYLRPIEYDSSDLDSYEQFPLGITNPHLSIDIPFFPIGFDESSEVGIIFDLDLRELASSIWPIPYALPYAKCSNDAGCAHEYGSWGSAFIVTSYIRSLGNIYSASIRYSDEYGVEQSGGFVTIANTCDNTILGNYPQEGTGEYACFKDYAGQKILIFKGNDDKCDPGACVDVYVRLWFRSANRKSSGYYATEDIDCHDVVASTNEASGNYRWNKCAGLIPGSPYFYLEKFARFELLGIPQIDYEPIICNSNREKIVPDLFHDGSGNDINLVHGKDSFVACRSDGFCSIDNGWASTPSDYTDISDVNDDDSFWQHDNLTTVLKDKVKIPDIFSENEFLCCVKLGETTESASNCCSGHAIYTTPGDPAKGMTCRLPYGADLNVYFNRFVSSDGLLEDSILREDKEPVGFTLDHFDGRTGEVKSNEDTDAILKKLGEKFCTGDSNNDPRYSDSVGHRVRRGSAVGNFQAGPTSYYYLGYQHPDHETNMSASGVDQNYLRMGFVDHYMDGEPADSNPNLEFDRGYYPYQSGYRWNNHFYCTGAPAN